MVINLTSNKTAIIDDSDYAEISSMKWSFDGRYAQHVKNRKKIYLHRLIMGAKRFQIIDHKNGNKLDNRKCNLRFATKSQNCMNSIKKNKLKKYKGVWWDKSRSKWCAEIMMNYKKIYIGRFDSEDDAARQYDEKAKDVFGEYALTNNGAI